MYDDSCWKMKDSKFITYQCCPWLEYISGTPTRRSRLLLSFSLSRQEDTDLWTCACCEALHLWQQMWHKIFLLDLNMDRFGVCDCCMTRGHTASSSHHWAYLHKATWTRKAQISNTGYQLSWPVLSTSTTQLPGIQGTREYVQCNTEIDFTQPKESTKVVSSYHFTPRALFTSWSL